MIDAFLLAFGTLFPIVNPVSTSFVFNSLAARSSKVERRRIAYRSAITAAIVLFVFMVVGNLVLSFFGITIYAFRVAGGIYMGWIGFEMLSPDLRKDPENYDVSDMSVIPLAIPLLSGPGAITATLALAQEATWTTYGVIGLAIVATMIISWLLLRHSHYITSLFGKTGTQAFERILGLIVLVIAVQFFFNGVSGYLSSIGFLA